MDTAITVSRRIFTVAAVVLITVCVAEGYAGGVVIITMARALALLGRF